MKVHQTILISVLGAMLLLSALAVVYAKYHARALFVELSALQHERDRMETDWERLQIELATYADPGYVERIARERLRMQVPDPGEVKILWH